MKPAMQPAAPLVNSRLTQAQAHSRLGVAPSHQNASSRLFAAVDDRAGV